MCPLYCTPQIIQPNRLTVTCEGAGIPFASFHFQDQKEQVKKTSQRLTSIFSFLEHTLLRGRIEKREKKKVKERESSNIREAREQREVAVEAVQ